MKTIKLALFRLLRYFEENRLIFVLYLLGSVTCVITFAYFYGNMMPNKHADARNSLLFRRYEVQLSKSLQLGTNDFAFLKSDPVEDIKLETPLLKELPGKSDDILAERGDGNYFNIQSYLYENTKIYIKRGRTEFREEERNSGANVVMVPSDALRMFAGGKKLTLAGTQYETIGVATFDTGFIIPYRAYEKQAYPTKKITVTTNRLLSIRESNDLTRRLYEKFPGSAIVEPEHLLVQNEVVSVLYFVMLCAVYLVSAAAFLFLLKYLADQSRGENVIYAMVGASKKKVGHIILAENLLLGLFSGTAGILLHAAFYQSFFSKINTLENITYTPADYLILFVFTLLLSLVTAIPFLLSHSRRTVIDSKNKFD